VREAQTAPPHTPTHTKSLVAMCLPVPARRITSSPTCRVAEECDARLWGRQDSRVEAAAESRQQLWQEQQQEQQRQVNNRLQNLAGGAAPGNRKMPWGMMYGGSTSRVPPWGEGVRAVFLCPWVFRKYSCFS